MIRMLLALTSLALTQDVEPRLKALVPPVPTPEGFIADQPSLIPAPALAALNARIRAIQDSGFGDIGVAIIPSIGDYQPYEVGVAIYRTWKIGRIDSIGSARRDLGVLILIVPKELSPDGKGQCWITTGRGAEGVVTDAASGSICRDQIIPFLRERNYAAAVGAGIEAISNQLHGDAGLTNAPAPRSLSSPRSRLPIGLGILGGGVGAILLSGGIRRWRRNRPRKCPRCGKPMVRLSEAADDEALNRGQIMEERLRSIDYDVWECDCGSEPIVLPYRKLLTGYRNCTKCGFRTARTTRRTLRQPTYTSSGLAEDTTRCKQCGAVATATVVLARLTRSSSSGGSSGGGGGGGSSFGGSGSTGGGGGGSSY